MAFIPHVAFKRLGESFPKSIEAVVACGEPDTRITTKFPDV